MSRARILADYVSSGDELADKAPLASPAFTGTPTGITATHVGLGNVTNESKATMLASPTLTGTVAIPNVANLETAVVANTAKVTNATHTGDVTGGTALTITADAVGSDELANDVVINTSGAITTSSTLTVTGTSDSTCAGNVLINTTQEFNTLNGRGNLVVGSGSANEGMTIYSGSAGSIMFADGTSGADAYTGQINYEHSDNSMDFRTNGGTERMHISSAGDVTVNTGNLVIGTHGKGIDFSANTDDYGTPASGAEVLDDYEEGTWTPTVTYGTVLCGGNVYTKVGRLVTVGGYVYSFSDNTTENYVTIGGLPFDTASGSYSTGPLCGRGLPEGQGFACSTSSNVDYFRIFAQEGASSGAYDYLLHSELVYTDTYTLIFFNFTYSSD
jgi:hypothetical protein